MAFAYDLRIAPPAWIVTGLTSGYLGRKGPAGIAGLAATDMLERSSSMSKRATS